MLLDGDAKISWDMFRYHRRLAFEDIVRFLDPTAADTVAAEEQQLPIISTRRSKDENGYEEYFRILAENSAALHYAGLGALFAYDFDDELRANDIPPWYLDVVLPRTTLVDYFFETYIKFVYDSLALHMLDAPLTHKYLPPGVAKQLLLLWQKVADASPVGPHHVTKDQGRQLGANRQFGLADDTMKEVYRKTWLPWCVVSRGVANKNYPNPEFIARTRSHFFEAVTPIVAISGAFVSVLTRHYQVEVPVYDQARLLTHKALANSYTFDERAPIMGGQSLKGRTDSYFDTESDALTNTELECHNSVI